MTDAANLAFNVDSSQAAAANQHLDGMVTKARAAEGSFRDLHAATMLAGAGMASFSSSLGMGSSQLTQLASSMQSVVSNLQQARSALDGMASSFATFDRARIQAESLASALGTGAVSMEAFARQSSQFAMSSLETASAMQRITAAIEGQTAAGRQLRNMMQEYGVVLNGITASQADKVLMQFAEKVRGFQATPINTQQMQQVLGPMSVDAISAIENPTYEPVMVKQHRLRTQAIARDSAASINASAIERRRIENQMAQLQDLQGRYGQNRYAGQLTDPDYAVDTMAAMYPDAEGGVPSTREMRLQQFKRQTATTQGNLEIDRFLAAHPDSALARSRRGMFGRMSDDWNKTPGARNWRGEFEPIYRAIDESADANYAQSRLDSASGAGGFGDTMLPALARNWWAKMAPRLAGDFVAPKMPVDKNGNPLPLTPEDLRKQQTADSGLLGDYGITGPQGRMGADAQLRNLGNSSDLSDAFKRVYGDAAGSVMLDNTRDRLMHSRDTAMSPGTEQLDQQAMQRWLQNVPAGQRGLARQMLSIAQANGVSMSAFTSRSFNDLAKSGATNAGALTGDMQSAAAKLQAGDDANFAATSNEQTQNQIAVQQNIRAALEQGAAAVERTTASWQAYYQVLQQGKGEDQAQVARLKAETDALQRQKTAAEQATVSLRQQNDAAERIAYGVAGVGTDPLNRARAATLGGIDNDVEAERRRLGAGSFNEGEYRAQRLRGIGTSAVSDGNAKVSAQLNATGQQRDLASVAGLSQSAQRQLLNDLETERDFRDQINAAVLSGNQAAIDGVIKQREQVKALKNDYDALKQVTDNLNYARDATQDATFNRSLIGLSPEQVRIARSTKPFLDMNRANPEVYPPGQGGVGPNQKLPDITALAKPYAEDFQEASRLTGGRISPETLAVLAYREGSLQADPRTDGTGGAGHRGMMQFDIPTARLRGLRVDGTHDDRLDPHLAIPAAGRELAARLDRAGITGKVNDAETLYRVTNRGGYGSSVNAETDALYKRSFQAGTGTTGPDSVALGINASRDKYLSENALANQEANFSANYALSQSAARRRALNAGTGSFGADTAAASIMGPEINAAEEAARRLASVIDGLNTKFTEQRASMAQTIEGTKGLSDAWAKGRQVGEEFERTLANNQQIQQLQNLKQSNPAMARRIGADGLITQLQGQNAGINQNAALQKGVDFEKQQASFRDQNELLGADVDAGPFASAQGLAAARAQVLTNQFMRTGATRSNGTPFSEGEVKATFDANEKMKQLAADTALVRNNFIQFGSAAMQGFENAVVGGEKLRNVLHSLAQDLEKTLLKSFVEQPFEKMFSNYASQATSSAGSWLSSLFSSGAGAAGASTAGASAESLALAAGTAALATGGVLAGPRFMSQGGVMTSPTRFMAQGGPVVGGEIDHEAILPLKRLPNGNLGVASSGGGGGHTIIVQSPITIQGGGGGAGGGGKMDPATMKAIQAQMEVAHQQAIRAVLTNERRDGGDLSGMGRKWQ